MEFSGMEVMVVDAVLGGFISCVPPTKPPWVGEPNVAPKSISTFSIRWPPRLIGRVSDQRSAGLQD